MRALLSSRGSHGGGVSSGALDLVGKKVVATYVLEAQSDEYNIVPKFSSPILLPLLVLVIALALVFSTKRFPRKRLISDLSANQEIIYWSTLTADGTAHC